MSAADATDATDERPATDGTPDPAARRPHRFARLVIEVCIAVLLVVLVRTFVVQSFYVPSGSMEPTVMPADRVLVDRLHGASGLRRGDIVVFDGTEAWNAVRSAEPEGGALGRILRPVQSALGIDPQETDYLKRIIGLPGDHVVCCTASGHLTINGAEVVEPYLPSGMRASEVTFDVTVPSGKLWLMGDNRPESADSRAHLGDPGGGMVPESDVIGRVTLRFWPVSRWGTMERSTTLSDLPTAG
ncbi:Signal peptidase I [Nostocoides japonicum T1-X7]|uniref:Signal peptidase I n=1 Tax=Nostocoides japonicum T1-X7 TaxID=1194083 RepID=A0A077M114_9MICO|nr:signal peptidase I [Tetrasphaera japonica]CCH77879.1 Signal peptidase I [Tetrasphaera japonica T1-X7]